jgi:hypothetical protein
MKKIFNKKIKNRKIFVKYIIAAAALRELSVINRWIMNE